MAKSEYRSRRRNAAFRSEEVKGQTKVWNSTATVEYQEHRARSKYTPHQGKREKARRASVVE